MTRALLVAAILAGATAHADVWKDAIEGGTSSEPGMSEYRRAMQDGDDHVVQASAHMVSPNERRRQIDAALASYRKASAARPKEADPHFRIAATLDAFLVCSLNDRPGRPIHTEIVDLCTDGSKAMFGPQYLAALDTAEQLAPLDPRFSVTLGDSAIFERAVFRTKLVRFLPLEMKKLLEGAAADYLKVIARSDDKPSDTVFANLAETHMMLGRLEEAVAMYDEAMARGAGLETGFGLAVALDRNGQTQRAAQTLKDLTITHIEDFHRRLRAGDTFFVPAGEETYYLGMLYEHLGESARALEYFKQFIKSNAHPQYQAAAKRHIDALGKAPPRPTLPHFDPLEF